MDTALPFGLRSAPKIFNALADALQWILELLGVQTLHYLDDFLIFGAPDTEEGSRGLKLALEMCALLGVPVAAYKTEGPSVCIVIMIDTLKGELRLPQEKLRRSGRKSCTKRELLSLIGHLQHACCVVRPGRSFLRRMILLSTVYSEGVTPQNSIEQGFEVRPTLAGMFPTSMEWHGMFSSVIRS